LKKFVVLPRRSARPVTCPFSFEKVVVSPRVVACKFTKEGEVALRVRKVADGRDWVELANRQHLRILK
jgi:hypothetical protein